MRTAAPRTLGLVAIGFMLNALGSTAASAKPHWFSGPVDEDQETARQALSAETASPDSPRLFDVVVSLYSDPQGDNDGATQGVDPGSAEQDRIERILQHFADGVYESTEGAHRIRNIRIFRNSEKDAVADIVWKKGGDIPAVITRPHARLNGIAEAGLHIFTVDNFQGDNLLEDELGAGYTLAHEWGHYAYGLFDEYRESGEECPTDQSVYGPCDADTAVVPSIMSNQWAANEGTDSLVDSRYLNFSIRNQDGSDPGPFENTQNTAHHRRYGASAWEVLSRDTNLISKIRGAFQLGAPVRIVYPKLAGVAPAGTEVPDFDPSRTSVHPDGSRKDLNIQWMTSDLALQVVIDRSGSMIGEKIENAKTAANLLVDLVEEGSTKIGVTSFSSSPTTVVPITEVTDQNAKNAIKAQLDGMVAGGGTAVGTAARAALNSLRNGADESDTKVVFLLSDGISGDDALGPIPDYVSEQVPIFAFSYGDDADTSTLESMATETKGELFISPTNLAAVTSAFQDANVAASDSANIAQGSRSLGPSGSSSVPIQVDSTLGRISISVTHRGGPSMASFELVAPDGARVGPRSVERSSGDTLSFFEVVEPQSGTWNLEGTGGGQADTEFEYQMTANPRASTFSLAASALSGESLEYPEPMVVFASLVKELPIAAARVNARIRSPDGSLRTLALADDGEAPDAVANDGMYAAVVEYDQNGAYELIVSASGEAGTARMTAAGLEASPGVNGAPLEPVPDVPVAEDFERFERFEVVAEGVVADDHGDTPDAATAISATNGELTAGKIELAGDVDVFEVVPPSGTSELVVRVAGLALGMDPRVEVLGSEGSEIVEEGTLEDSRAAAGHLALPIDVERQGRLFIRVVHRDHAAGTGQYGVSAGQLLSADQPDETRLRGDLDGDGDVDQDDVDIVLAGRGESAESPSDPRDMDRDGEITGLDARKVVLRCTRDRCKTEAEVAGTASAACGIGFELTPLLLSLAWAWRRRAHGR